jgi:hypothetical protein
LPNAKSDATIRQSSRAAPEDKINDGIDESPRFSQSKRGAEGPNMTERRLGERLNIRPTRPIIRFRSERYHEAMSREDSSRKQVIPAPVPSDPRLRSTVLDVECTEEEHVEWIWTETPNARFVSGYRIVPKVQDRASSS